MSLVCYERGQKRGDASGKASDTFRPVYDGTMEDCDGVFKMLAGYLRALGAHEAKELIVLGDGAKWIWERVAPLTKAVGIEPEKVRQVVDWFHAVEVVDEVADARAQWPEGERAKWVKRAKDLLHAGNTVGLMAHFDDLGVGRRGTVVNKHRDYFESNTARMANGVPRLRRGRSALRERSHRKRHPARHQPADEGQRHLLAN